MTFNGDIKEALGVYGLLKKAAFKGVLMVGPPGTGKTSICKALAHKVSIRMSDKYDEFQFVEINSHSLFSRWFSESGKLVQKMFDQLLELLEEPKTFLFVLVRYCAL